ncbi:hypothetical protein [Apilactobacillus kunkeei]|uniref:hypothetical protein n=1 Tax=Apilactobacillus kunkeei TaxID=148814 RepID=UPI00070C5F70|nr:hypothetical protein [Apilactobacillus kunkeei]
MGTIISILILLIVTVYDVVRNIRNNRVIRDTLNNYDNVVKVRAMIEEYDEDSEIVKAIKDEFNVSFYPATKIFISVKKMK